MSSESVPREFPKSAVRGDLERRYRRALRLLPAYYRQRWEEDMVDAFLDSSLTGDPEEDEFTLEYGKPSWPELASVAGLAVRLYLGGAGAPRRYFTWGQAVRSAVLAVTLARATQALGSIAVLAWAHRLLGLPAPPAQLVARSWDGIWAVTWYVVGYAWIVAYIALVRGYYRTAQVMAVLAIAPALVYLLRYPGWWTWWILFDLVPVLGMAAFHSGAPPVTRRTWRFALPVCFVLVAVPVIALQASGNASWLNQPGLYCILVSVACLAHALSARSRRSAGPGEWSLALILLAAAAGTYQIIALIDDPRLLTAAATATSKAGGPELVVLAAAVAADGHFIIATWKPRGLRQAALLLTVLGVAAGVITLAAVGRLNSSVTFGRVPPPPGQAASAIVVTPVDTNAALRLQHILGLRRGLGWGVDAGFLALGGGDGAGARRWRADGTGRVRHSAKSYPQAPTAPGRNPQVSDDAFAGGWTG